MAGRGAEIHSTEEVQLEDIHPHKPFPLELPRPSETVHQLEFKLIEESARMRNIFKNARVQRRRQTA